ncbi:hypothetical protein POX_h09381 [Penicillium oxalicum]|uniref:hypothetical protein n=1 Tax=Penicillium oxalicum TaxID=69781 RepID=UPI0020B7B595|nr:hypothetical protein POX_h09381 [Penicillium oxalicum]KAI2785625.1 hypothetical protein POX_h09381 [Penicillium oxalicum]
MPVLLDNIQFYHGPSKPAKPPYLALNSSQKGSKGSNALLPDEQPAFSIGCVSSATDDLAVVPMGFDHPATSTEDITDQHEIGSSNIFDLELARSCGAAMPLLCTLDASDGDACPSLRGLDCHGLYNSAENSPSDYIFPRSQPRCTSPLRPPQSPAIAVPLPDSAISHPEITQSHVVENVPWRRNQPSPTPADAWDMPDVSTACSEHCPNTALSSVSSCSDVASKRRNDMDRYVPSPEDYLGNCSHDYEEARQTRLISDCSPRTVADSGPSGPVDPLLVDMPDSMELEQANGHESVISHSRTPSVQAFFPDPRRCKGKEQRMLRAGKRDSTRNKYHTAIAVVIPPPRPRPVRSVRLKTKLIPSDVNRSEGSEGLGDFSDEDLTSDIIQSELSDVEDSLKEKHGLPSTAAPCHGHDTSMGSSTGHFEHRDIVGRAILTIETQGSETTFFFTLMPDNVRSRTCVPAQRIPNSFEKPGRISKRSISTARPTRGKGKSQTYSTHEKHLLVELKEQRKLTWKEIADHFPGRTSSALQVYYCTKLNQQRAKRSGPRSRRGKKK